MVNRRGVSILEVIVASLLVAAVLAPMLGSIARQSRQGRGGRDRLYAVQLANDVLEMLTERGYEWMYRTADLGGGATIMGQGPGAGVNRLQMDTTVGVNPSTNAAYPGHWVPNALNPALSGPQVGDPNLPVNFQNGLSVDGVAVNNARTTFQREFNRRVEIFGGQSYTPPGIPGAPVAHCFMVRVTISPANPNLTPPAIAGVSDNRYQVVTFIGRR